MLNKLHKIHAEKFTAFLNGIFSCHYVNKPSDLVSNAYQCIYMQMIETMQMHQTTHASNCFKICMCENVQNLTCVHEVYLLKADMKKL